MKRPLFLVIAALACVHHLAVAQDGLQPRPLIKKPAHTRIESTRHDLDRVSVMFRDGVTVRLRNGKPRQQGADTQALNAAEGLLARLAAGGARWERQHHAPEEKLAEMRATAQRRTGKASPDLNNAYILRVPKTMGVEGIIDELNALDVVELAEPMPLPAPPPAPRNFQPDQGYLKSAPSGIDADYAWTFSGGDGDDVWIADVENSWNLDHSDLSATLVGGPRHSGASDPLHVNHGTAVLGVLGSLANGFGTRGIASDSRILAVTSWPTSGYNPTAAISTAAAALRPGDILLIEMQSFGPTPETHDYVPIEWLAGSYQAIRTAVDNGIIVVEAAGNGSQNLDDPMFNIGHAPFLPENDSGAIIVGAGGVATYSGERVRVATSSFGSTVDLQGWGEQIVTTGYGDKYNSEGENLFYTPDFGGTSGASAIIAGVCAALQGHHKSTNGGAVLSPADARAILRLTGSPQRDSSLAPAGTFSQSGTTLTRASGTRTFSLSDLNTIVRFSTGQQAMITAILSATQVTMDTSQNVAATTITLLRPATQYIGPRPDLRAAMAYVTGPVVWLDFNSTAPIQNGAFLTPYKTMPAAYAAATHGGFVNVKSGEATWTGTTGQPQPKIVTFRTFGGSTTIGKP